MRIVVAGGTGFLGSALCAALASDGHEVVVLTRAPRGGARHGVRHVAWAPDGGMGPWSETLAGPRLSSTSPDRA